MAGIIDRAKVFVSSSIVRDKAFYKKIALLALPMIIQGLVNVGVTITDTLMVASLGEAQISASSLGGQFFGIGHVMCMGLGFGAAVMTAQYWGRNDMKSFRKVITLMLRVSILVALSFALVTLAFPSHIMSIYTNETAIINEGVKYFKYLAYAFIFQGLSLPLALVFRSTGKTVVPLVGSLIAFTVNIFANWVFIFGNLGAPRMEISGAALGTMISFACEAVFILVYVFCVDKTIRYRIKNLIEPCGDLLKEFGKFSVPVIISDTLLGLGSSGIAIVMGHIGASFVAANAIVAAITRLSTVAIQGMSNAGAVVVGNTLGSGDEGRAYKEGCTFFGLSILLGIVSSLIVLLIGHPMIGFYNITDETIAIAKQLIYAVSIQVIFSTAANMLTKGVLRGGGDTRFLMVADIIFLWVVSIPLGALAGLYFRLPPFWTYLCLYSEAFIKFFVGAKRLFGKKWIYMVK